METKFEIKEEPAASDNEDDVTDHLNIDGACTSVVEDNFVSIKTETEHSIGIDIKQEILEDSIAEEDESLEEVDPLDTGCDKTTSVFLQRKYVELAAKPLLAVKHVISPVLRTVAKSPAFGRDLISLSAGTDVISSSPVKAVTSSLPGTAVIPSLPGTAIISPPPKTNGAWRQNLVISQTKTVKCRPSNNVILLQREPLNSSHNLQTVLPPNRTETSVPIFLTKQKVKAKEFSNNASTDVTISKLEVNEMTETPAKKCKKVFIASVSNQPDNGLNLYKQNEESENKPITKEGPSEDEDDPGEPLVLENFLQISLREKELPKGNNSKGHVLKRRKLESKPVTLERSLCPSVSKIQQGSQKTEEIFRCSMCGEMEVAKTELVKHVKVVHAKDLEADRLNGFLCPYCKSSCHETVKGLYIHVKLKHMHYTEDSQTKKEGTRSITGGRNKRNRSIAEERLITNFRLTKRSVPLKSKDADQLQNTSSTQKKDLLISNKKLILPKLKKREGGEKIKVDGSVESEGHLHAASAKETEDEDDSQANHYLQCSFCKIRIQNSHCRSHYDKHVADFEKLGKHLCPYCDFTSKELGTLLDHFVQVHARRQKCNNCNVRFMNLASHKEKCLGINLKTCKLCGKNIKYLTNHSCPFDEKKLKMNTVECGQCGNLVKYKYLKIHMKNHCVGNKSSMFSNYRTEH